MDNSIAGLVLQCAGIISEAALIVYLARRGLWKRQGAVAFYLGCLLLTELARAGVLYANGLNSPQYFYVYWSTDFLLVISAFLAVCFFFRRACLREERMWRYVRLLLPLTLILVVAISSILFLHNYHKLFFSYFVVEFNQNLYFTCLVLNTLLYLLLQYIESTDDQLGLLVCGLGIQFAGPAATFALVHLTPGEAFARSLSSTVMRLCTLGALFVWAYAVMHVQDKAIRVAGHEVPVLAEVTGHI